MDRPPVDWRFLALASAITIASLCYWWQFSQGGLSSLSYDSFRYLAGAESFLSEGSYRDLDGRPQRVWPPGTSLLYAAVARVTHQPAEKLVPKVNLVAMLATLLAFARVLVLARVRWWIAAATFAALAWNGIFLSATTKLWSDPIALAILLTILWFCLEASPGFFVAANALALVALSFRFAMLATVLLLLVAALLRRRLLWLPFVTGAAMLLLVFSTRGAGGGAHPVQWRANWQVFVELTHQMIPSSLIVVVIAIVIPIIFARRSPHVVLAVTWVVAYSAFILAAQAVANPSFTTDLRILFPLYPGLLLAASAGAETMPSRLTAALVTLVIGIGALRGGHYIEGSMRAKPGVESCVSREALVTEVRRVAGRAQNVVSNAQGLVWYALRRPVRRPLAAGEAVWIDRRIACPSSIDDDVPAPAKVLLIGEGPR